MAWPQNSPSTPRRYRLSDCFSGTIHGKDEFTSQVNDIDELALEYDGGSKHYKTATEYAIRQIEEYSVGDFMEVHCSEVDSTDGRILKYWHSQINDIEIIQMLMNNVVTNTLWCNPTRICDIQAYKIVTNTTKGGIEYGTVVEINNACIVALTLLKRMIIWTVMARGYKKSSEIIAQSGIEEIIKNNGGQYDNRLAHTVMSEFDKVIEKLEKKREDCKVVEKDMAKIMVELRKPTYKMTDLMKLASDELKDVFKDCEQIEDKRSSVGERSLDACRAERPGSAERLGLLLRTE